MTTGWGGIREEDMKYIRTATVDSPDGAPDKNDVLLRLTEYKKYTGLSGTADAF